MATADLKAPIDLEVVKNSFPIIFEPEQFLGTIWKPKELNGAAILIFASGKIVVVGLKSMQALEQLPDFLELKLHKSLLRKKL